MSDLPINMVAGSLLVAGCILFVADAIIGLITQNGNPAEDVPTDDEYTG
jgi:hypothetical protein